jgi:hypothetical protein
VTHAKLQSFSAYMCPLPPHLLMKEFRHFFACVSLGADFISDFETYFLFQDMCELVFEILGMELTHARKVFYYQTTPFQQIFVYSAFQHHYSIIFVKQN